MRGRGGRGRFSGRGNATQDLIRDNLEDLGLDVYQRFDDGTPPPLYPSIPIPAPSGLTESDIFLVQKSREITHRCHSSPYCLRRKIPVTDIQRYTDKYKKPKEVSLLEFIRQSGTDFSRFLPSELIEFRGGNCLEESKSKNKAGFNLNKLELAEASGQNKAHLDKKEDNSENEDAEQQDPDEFEGDDDYGVDHYASDDGGGGDDGDEAFF